MTPERARIYENAFHLVNRIGELCETEDADPSYIGCLADSVGALLTALNESEVCGVAHDAFPALMRWMRLATAHTARRAPLDVAAAWEARALVAELNGDIAAADDQLERARAVAA